MIMDGHIDSARCSQLIRLSCSKIVMSRNQKGGCKLHKNLLILHLITKARDTQHKLEIEAEYNAMILDDLTSSSKDVDDEENCPPLEFSVTDSEEEHFDGDEPLAFACEAFESFEGEEPEEPSSLNPAIDDALCRLADRKRKPSAVQPENRAPLRKRTVKTAERTVPQLRPTVGHRK